MESRYNFVWSHFPLGPLGPLGPLDLLVALTTLTTLTTPTTFTLTTTEVTLGLVTLSSGRLAEGGGSPQAGIFGGQGATAVRATR